DVVGVVARGLAVVVLVVRAVAALCALHDEVDLEVGARDLGLLARSGLVLVVLVRVGGRLGSGGRLGGGRLGRRRLLGDGRGRRARRLRGSIPLTAWRMTSSGRRASISSSVRSLIPPG